jgi:hypothetical protein
VADEEPPAELSENEPPRTAGGDYVKALGESTPLNEPFTETETERETPEFADSGFRVENAVAFADSGMSLEPSVSAADFLQKQQFQLTKWLLWVTVALTLGVGIVALTAGNDVWTRVSSQIGYLMTPFHTLLGIAIGYYFGSKFDKKD